MYYKKSFKSQRPSHGHSKNMFAEVRRKSYQKSFSLKINNEFLNTQYVDIVGLSVLNRQYRQKRQPEHIPISFVYSLLW